MPKKLSEREEQLICEQYADNWALRRISVYANVSVTTIMVVLRRNGVQLRCGKRISKEQEEQVVLLYTQGNSILDIISKSGVKSEQTIYRILSDAGVKRRRNTNITYL